MATMIQNNDQQNRNYINVHESGEVAYWTKELGITEEKLVAAVMAAGTAVKSVRYHLANRR